MNLRVYRFRNSLFLSLLIFLFIFFCFISSAQARDLTEEAQQIFEKHNSSIVQIRVISLRSGEKAALGSGFFFEKDGIAATNFHVVSKAVNHPSSYFVEYIASDGAKGKMEILNVDPVHDLVILRADEPLDTYLKLGGLDLSKGEKIFSFGNPYDLGMIVVEGLYNGLLEHSRYRKILFSGSLNPGMSGGPAVFRDGSVLGVNVATAGNDISFFVPVYYLKKLYQEVVSNNGKALAQNWEDIIGARLAREQEVFVERVINAKNWDKRQIGIVKVPAEISSEFKCWDRPADDKRSWIKDAYLTCSTEDQIFISDSFHTGSVYFQYEWYQSKGYNPFRFYNLYELYASNREYRFGNAERRDAGNFICDQNVVDVKGKSVKIEFCTRAYRAYKGLFDINFQISRIDMFNQGLVVNISLLGVTDKQSKNFLKKFISEIEWEK